jgi:hypothetical protein
MPSLYDVPTDVIQFVIFPYLDNKSRFIANDVLHPSRQIEYRFPSRIPEETRIKHAIKIATQIFAKLLKNATKGPYDSKTILKLFRKILKGDADILFQHNINFRTETYLKMFKFIDINYTGYNTVSKGYKKGLINISSRIIQRLDKLPYVREIRYIYNTVVNNILE